MSNIPEDLQYTAEHEWAQVTAGGAVRIGITDHAQAALGDVVFVSLPEIGKAVVAGEPFGEIESTKSVSDLYAPVTGVVSARNDSLDSDPAQLNSEPYGAGWIVEITVAEGEASAAIGDLLDASGYEALVS
jgi:glycine cleavage system H protein